ncbi:MAG: NADH-quinone oxidoreductase subunit D [Chloroflexi bacterium]|nr:NADH-quinone oxidoreductase subunit D [Chloroflexota bacterium]
MEAEKRFDTVDMMLNMGPQHPSTHGVFRMVLTIDGEKIVAVEPHIGYLHRGTEKLCEGEYYLQIVSLFDRLDYISSFNNELAFVIAVEKLMGIQVPERAEYIRVIMCELNRIASHLMFYAAFGADAGAITPFLYAFREREQIQSVFEAVSGARMMHNYFRVGGVIEDLPPDFGDRMNKLIPKLKQGIQECDDLLTGNEIFIARAKGVGAISAADAIDFGMSGPNLRACGVLEDIRRSEPYSVYPTLDFDIPAGQNGDCWDRYMVRMEEMRQSLRIVEQAIAEMPQGPVIAPQVRKIVKVPKGEVYVRVENPRGDFGVYLISQGGDKPYRVKIRGASFCNLMTLKKLLQQCYVADCVVVLGSLDIVLGEVDR